jgi:hypothetical protein
MLQLTRKEFVKNRSRHPPRPSQNPIPSYPHQGRRSHPYQEIASQEGEPRRSREGREKVRKKELKRKQKRQSTVAAKIVVINLCPTNSGRPIQPHTHTQESIYPP